jgi:hypothetical protein
VIGAGFEEVQFRMRRMGALVLLLFVQLPDDAPANPQRGREQQCARHVFHAQQDAR